jgi:hypothetical protein
MIMYIIIITEKKRQFIVKQQGCVSDIGIEAGLGSRVVEFSLSHR